MSETTHAQSRRVTFCQYCGGKLHLGYHFTCHICGEPSNELCVRCTNDVCANHRCEKCKRCSDCCQCELRRARD